MTANIAELLSLCSELSGSDVTTLALQKEQTFVQVKLSWPLCFVVRITSMAFWLELALDDLLEDEQSWSAHTYFGRHVL